MLALDLVSFDWARCIFEIHIGVQGRTASAVGINLHHPDSLQSGSKWFRSRVEKYWTLTFILSVIASPGCSMYGIFTYTLLKFMIHVSRYIFHTWSIWECWLIIVKNSPSRRGIISKWQLLHHHQLPSPRQCARGADLVVKGNRIKAQNLIVSGLGMGIWNGIGWRLFFSNKCMWCSPKYLCLCKSSIFLRKIFFLSFFLGNDNVGAQRSPIWLIPL